MANGLPPGAKAIEQGGSGGLPPGAKAVADEAPETPSKSIFETVGIEGIPTDPELAKIQTEINKGVLSGIAQVPVGIGQTLSDLGASTPRGRAAQKTPILPKKEGESADKWLEWSKTLKDFGDPSGQMIGRAIGETGAFMAGGETAAATELGQAATKFAAPYVAKYVSPLVPEYLSGLKNLLGAGAEAKPVVTAAAEAAPKAAVEAKNLDFYGRAINELKEGVTQTGKKLAEGGKEAAKGAVTGAVPGAIFGGVGGAIDPRTEATVKERQAARWEEIKHGFQTGSIFGGVLGAAVPVAQMTGELGGLLKKGWNQMTLSEQRKAVELSEKAINDLRSDIQAQTAGFKSKEEVRLEALENAKGLKLNEEQTQAFVETAQKNAQLAEEEVAKIIEDFRNLPTKSEVKFGNFLEERLEKFKTKLESDREKAAGFPEALASAPKGKVVDTQPIVDYIDSVMGDYLSNSPTRAMLQKLRDGFAPRAAEEAASAEGITVAAANTARKEFNHMKSVRDLKALGVDAVSQEQIHHLDEVVTLLNKAAGQAHPPYMEAVQTFARESRALDPFRTGGFSVLGGIDAFSGTNTQLGADILKGVLKEARKGDPALAKLIETDPELKEMAKQYLTGELFGVENAQKAMTKNRFTDFWKKNQELTDQLGMTPYFKELQQRYESGEGRLLAAKENLTQKQKEAKEINAETKQAAADIERSEKIQKSLATMEAKIKNTNDPKDIITNYKSWAENLLKDDLIDVPTFDKLLNGMNQAELEFAQTKDALAFSEKVRGYVIGILLVSGLGGYAATSTGIGRALSGYSPGGHRREE